MAKSTSIVLTATAIGMGNEFIQGYGINFRMGIAGLGAALFVTGIEKINETAGVGLGVLVLITVLLTPFKGRAPSQEALALIHGQGIRVAAAGPKAPVAPSPGPARGVTIA